MTARLYIGDVPPRTWGLYARRVYELNQRKGVKVYDRKGFEESVAADGIRRLSEQAQSWWTMFLTDERRLAEWLVDGKPSVYAERRAA